MRAYEGVQLGKIVETMTFGASEQREVAYDTGIWWDLDRSVEFVKKRQPTNPSNPGKPFPRDIRVETMDVLGIDDPEECNAVRFYTAINSPLDRYFGVDGFIEVPYQGRIYRVTFDVTTNPNKTRHKADVVIFLPREGLDHLIDDEPVYKNVPLDKRPYYGTVSLVAQAVFLKIKAEMNNTNDKGGLGQKKFYVDSSNLTSGVRVYD